LRADQIKTVFITPLWSVFIHNNIIRVEERRSQLSTGHPTVPCGPATSQH
jgi:hypothetical protein